MGYVDVIIDNSSNQTDQFYTYKADLSEVHPGDKVFVPFARGNKLREAYVFEVSETAPEGITRIREIDSKDPEISLTPESLEVCRWMKERYFCRYIDAVKCFVPAGKPSKRGKVRRPELEMSEEKPAVPELTEEQAKAMVRIRPWLEKREHRTFVIRGVTGSGKTELYMRVVQECLALGRTALVLVPEISLTDQIVSRFLDRFGREEVAVLHSKLSQGERYDEWMRLKQGQARIVIGARSAIFAPLTNVGALILDEEHETTYKSDMTPKYDTAEVAEQLARRHGALVVLGSATPSMTASYKAAQGEYEEILLKERYNKNPLPSVEVMDMREELKAGNRSIFSRALFSEMETCLNEGRQVILFLNRRGYSTFLSCRECGYVVKCPECGISMTYHRQRGEAVCHYCGRHKPLPDHCPSCKGPYLRQFGAGTEKVEELTRQAFPDAAIERMDLDTVKKKGSAAAILNRFRKGKTQILIGTQLVAKGLDFRNVGLVGVIS
ncbi:MAG: primosomal protein N', partial [Firmicutes bacterium]|nr:primosomal protein N' [Bacillota bacterium]